MAQELAIPDKPVTVTIASYEVIGFSWDRKPDWRFTITYQDSTGKTFTDYHYGLTVRPGPTGPVNNPEGADSLIKQLETANLTTSSLTKELIKHLVTHGKIPASTVTGKPETDK
jgi:hypothetical protein